MNVPEGDLSRTAPPDGRHGELHIRPWRLDDIDDLAGYWARNRIHLTPTQPSRGDAFWTAAGQRVRVASHLEEMARGRMVPLLVLEDGAVVADVALSDIVGGVFMSAVLGYSVDARRLRRGIATWAVAAAVDIAFTAMRLHRIQAGTLPENVASQAVLERSGFEPIGMARNYLAIAGMWRHHVLWQLTNPLLPPPAPS
jgi:ribosomal-protein-alanine N-acetyltransferase